MNIDTCLLMRAVCYDFLVFLVRDRAASGMSGWAINDAGIAAGIRVNQSARNVRVVSDVADGGSVPEIVMMDAGAA
ncbi:MAG: hypothetical protein JWL59_4379 [Chthoniobacteraceae bacterium]|nr:hypothetical protein [Chthoniobacteraceae bacterium]